MEEKNNYVIDKEVEVIGIDIEKEKGKEDVKRIRIKTTEFDITYKPETETVQYQDGMKMIGVRQLSINEIPSKIKEIAKIISEKKSCKVKVGYGLFDTTDGEGSPVTYRYIRFASQLDKWEIL